MTLNQLDLCRSIVSFQVIFPLSEVVDLHDAFSLSPSYRDKSKMQVDFIKAGYRNSKWNIILQSDERSKPFGDIIRELDLNETR